MKKEDLPPLPQRLLNLAAEGEQEAFAQEVQSYARLAVQQERERCAAEAEHWQTISRPEHKCGEYIAAAIRWEPPS